MFERFGKLFVSKSSNSLTETTTAKPLRPRGNTTGSIKTTTSKMVKIRSVSDISHIKFTIDQEQRIGNQIIDIYNGDLILTENDMKTMTDLEILSIYGKYHINITKNHEQIKLTYCRMMELECEQAYIQYGHYLFEYKNRVSEAICVLETAIEKLNSKPAKFVLAQHYMLTSLNQAIGLRLLNELAIQQQYFPAMYELIYYFKEEGDIKNVKKYIYLPFSVDDSYFGTARLHEQMKIVIYIMHKLCTMQEIYANLSRLTNKNRFVEMEFYERYDFSK